MTTEFRGEAIDEPSMSTMFICSASCGCGQYHGFLVIPGGTADRSKNLDKKQCVQTDSMQTLVCTSASINFYSSEKFSRSLNCKGVLHTAQHIDVRQPVFLYCAPYPAPPLQTPGFACDGLPGGGGDCKGISRQTVVPSTDVSKENTCEATFALTRCQCVSSNTNVIEDPKERRRTSGYENNTL